LHRAHAQTPALPYTIGRGRDRIGTAIGLIPPAKRIEFYNSSDTAKIAVCPTSAATATPTITCTVNGAGSITLCPSVLTGRWRRWRAAGQFGMERDRDSGGSALTVFEWE